MPDEPFQLLGLPRRFDLDQAAIQRAYLAKSAALHPDLAAGDPEVPRMAAAVNTARRILSDPERRASALLAALGGPSKEQDRSLPDGFLAEMLETREAIEEARASQDPGARERWEKWAGESRAGYIASVGRMFAALGERPDPVVLREIRTRLNAWRYIERLIEQLDPAYDPAKADFN